MRKKDTAKTVEAILGIKQDERIWSEFQNDIYTFGKEKEKNLIIQAVAGSGKSTTLFELAKRIGGEIIFLAFNKIIAEYAKDKLRGHRNIDCRTFHSLGMQLVSKATGFFADVETGKLTMYFNGLDEFNKKYYPWGDFYPKFIARRIVKMIRQLGMMSYDVDDIRDFIRETPGLFAIDPRKRAEEEAWVYSHVHSFPMWLKELDKLPVRPGKDAKTGNKVNTYATVIDFDDMVRLPCIHNLGERYPIPQKTALVDESQDMNPYQVHFVTQLYKKGVRTICCGDRLQAIYSFRGAYMDSMDRMKNTTKAEELPLSVTYRSRKTIVDFINLHIEESSMIAHKEGGEVVSIQKANFVQEILENDVRMIVGAKNKSLLECWILLAKNKISSTLKGSGIVKEIRDMITDIKPRDIEELCSTLQEAVSNATEVNEDGEITYKEAPARVELMSAIPQLVETYGIGTLPDLEVILSEMEKDAIREIHTVHSSKGLEARTVTVLCDWFPGPQMTNMQYVAYSRAEDKLMLVTDWCKEKEAV